MKRSIRIIGLLLLLLPGVVRAGEGVPKPKKGPKVRMEWGVTAGAGFWSYAGGDNLGDLKGRMGWQAGISMAAVWGRLALQPEIRFVRHGVDLTLPGEARATIDLKSSSIDVPVLFSVRAVDPLRIYAGPVLTAMNRCSYADPDGLALDVGHVRPTVGYTVGASVVLGRRMLLDLRYTGGFGSVGGVFWNEGPEVKLRGHAVQFSIGYVFK